MNDFFQSEIVMEELKEINTLQEEVMYNIMNFGNMSKEDRLEHVDKLALLLDKQQVMYARLSLSDDPQASQMKENLHKSIVMMGFSPDTDMNYLFQSFGETIKSLRASIDA